MKKKQKQRVSGIERVAAFEKDEPMQWADVKCTICFGIYIDPVTFPCKHSVCLRCFNKFIRETSLNCPCCRYRLSVWSRTHIKKNTLVNLIFTERIKTEFPNEVTSRLREIEQEDDDMENGYDGPRIDDSGFKDESIFENSQNNAPRDGELSKPGEIGKELHDIYIQHQQELDKERRRKELEEEQASQLLIRQLLSEDEPYASQLQSDLELAKMMAEEGSEDAVPTVTTVPKVTTSVHAPPMLGTNLLNQLQSQNASQSMLLGSQNISSQYISSSQVRPSMKPTPKSKPNGKSGVLKGISKAPKRRQPPRNSSSTTSSSKRACVRSRGASSTSSSQAKLDKKQTKIGSYFSPTGTPSPTLHDSVIELTPNSSSQRVEHFSSSRKLPWDSPTVTPNNKELKFDILNDDEEAPGPSSRSLHMRSASVTNATGIITLAQTSPVKLITMTQNSELTLISPPRTSKQNSPAKCKVDMKCITTTAAAGSSDDNNNNLAALSPSRLHLSQMSLGGVQASSSQSSLGDEMVGGSQSSVGSAIYNEEQFEKYREEEIALERFRLRFRQEEEDRKLAEKIQRNYMSGEPEFRGRGQKESYSIRNWIRGGGNPAK